MKRDRGITIGLSLWAEDDLGFDRSPPLGVEPQQDSQGTHFDGPGRHNLHAPQVVVVHRGNVDRPDRPRRGEQASESLLPTNVLRVVLCIRRLGPISNLDDGNVLIPGRGIALAARVKVNKSFVI